MMKNIGITLFLVLTVILYSSCIKDFQPVTINPYEVGDYYSEAGVMGIVYKVSDDGAHGMIVSLSEVALPWGDTLYYKINDTVNGVLNMNKVKEIPDWQKKFPAFYWCDNKNRNGISGWYLPAKNEYEEILKQRIILNKTLLSIGAKSFSGKNYWTSTEYSNFEAYHADFIIGEIQYYAVKTNNMVYVRAIKAF